MGPLMTSTLATEDLNYYSKISKVSFPSYVCPENTFIILDWDDTLMCTTFISLKKDSLSQREMTLVEYLGQKVTSFLIECKKCGKVIILTNGSMVWVKSCSEKFLKINPEIFEDIFIISARDKYSKTEKYKNLWKRLALEDLFQKRKDNTGVLNFLCVSDTREDIDIFKSVKREYHEWMNLSTVKLQMKPSPLVMIREIEFMSRNLEKVIGKNHNFYLDDESDKEKENKSKENVNNFFSFSFFGF